MENFRGKHTLSWITAEQKEKEILLVESLLHPLEGTESQVQDWAWPNQRDWKLDSLVLINTRKGYVYTNV